MSPFEKFCAIFIACCLLILALCADGAICWHLGYDKGYKAGWNDCLSSAQADTTQHVDTSSYVNPKPVDVEPVATIPAGYVQVKAGTIAQLKARIAELEAAALTTPVDSAAVPIEDTPVNVDLPVERKVYQDSTYRAVVEGIQARLAEIQTFNLTTTITQTIVQPAPRWTFGLTAGPSVVWNPNGLHAGVGLTAGLQYRF